MLSARPGVTIKVNIHRFTLSSIAQFATVSKDVRVRLRYIVIVNKREDKMVKS